jgi:hypothetical protein
MRVLGWKVAGAVVLCGVMVGSAAAQLDDPAVAKQKYETYKTRVMGGDMTVDWRAFRLAAMVGGVDGGFDWQPVRNQVLKDADAGKDDAALAGANQIIAHNMANPEGHVLAMIVLRKLGKNDAADKERAVVDAIVKSIMESGDGKSAKTAWFTVDPSEEYFVINVVLGAQPKGQALVQQDGHAFDKMTVVDDKGGEHVLWFNTDTDIQIMDAALNQKKK